MGDLISWREPVLQKGWIIWSPLLYFNFKSFEDQNFSSFIRFQSILHDSGVLFSDFSNFHKLKGRVQISWGEQILRNGWIICSPVLYFSFDKLNELSSLSFIWIWFNSTWLSRTFSHIFKISWNWRRRTWFVGGKQFCRRAELFGPPFYISILKVLRTQILCHSLGFNAFCMIQKYFSQTFSNFRKLKREDLISWGKLILQKGWIIWSPLLYFNFKSFEDPNSLS